MGRPTLRVPECPSPVQRGRQRSGTIAASFVPRIGKKALKSPTLWALAALSFIAIYFFQISFVIIVLAAALLGYVGNRVYPKQFPAGKGHGAAKATAAAIELPPAPPATWTRTFSITALCLTLWWLPIFAKIGRAHV